MNPNTPLAVAAAVLAAAAARPAPAQHRTARPDELFAVQTALQAAVERAAPAVVTIETFGGTRPTRIADRASGGREDGPRSERGNPSLRLRAPGFLQARGTSTGVVLTPDGWIVTSRFTLGFDPTTVLVTLPDGRSLPATRAGEDTSRGLALLKVDADDLPTLPEVPPDEIHVGAWAFALGRTFGRERPSVHVGIVSATGRLFGRAVQVDAYTSPANYGGPVIDLAGRMYGIATPLSPSGRDVGAEWYDSGIGFAARLDGLRPFLDRLKAGETVYRPWLGATLAADGGGARIERVEPEGPAAAAGFTDGDRIVGEPGEAYRHVFDVRTAIGRRHAGETVVFEVVPAGGGETVRREVVLGRPPRAERASGALDEETFTPPWEGDGPAPDRGR